MQRQNEGLHKSEKKARPRRGRETRKSAAQHEKGRARDTETKTKPGRTRRTKKRARKTTGRRGKDKQAKAGKREPTPRPPNKGGGKTHHRLSRRRDKQTTYTGERTHSKTPKARRPRDPRDWDSMRYVSLKAG